jgi:hypothetical protein
MAQENYIKTIHPSEIRKIIRQLIKFLGQSTIENCIANYNKSLLSSGPTFREYYLKTRHPWWEALNIFFELERSGKSVQKHITEDLKRCCRDGKIITTLQKTMPEKVRNKYKKDLIDKNRARDYLFELSIAWHFYQNGFEIKWYAEEGCPEFLVKTSNFDLNVECKRVSVDASRKIRKRDYYRLADTLLPKIEKRHLQGKIDIILNDRLHGSDQYIDRLSNQIFDALKSYPKMQNFDIPYGSLSLDLMEQDGKPIDFNQRSHEFLKRKGDDGHGALFAKGEDGCPMNPLELTIRSKKANKVLLGIKDRIKEAVTKQLDPSKPGLIVCFLESIDDLNDLAKDSRLQQMSSYLLGQNGFGHIAAIGFSSEERITQQNNAELFDAQGLIFRNPNCCFNEQIKDFQFLSNQTKS